VRQAKNGFFGVECLLKHRKNNIKQQKHKKYVVLLLTSALFYDILGK